MTADKTRPTIWLCGATAAAEFQACREWLTERYCVREAAQDVSRSAASAPVAILDVRDTWSPAAGARLERWAAEHPLAIVLQFLGPWCDGMGRSPGFFPGVIRVSWQHWEAELPTLLQPRNFIPRTANEADRLLELSRQRQANLAGIVGMVARSNVAAEVLADAVAACGAQGVMLRAPEELATRSVDVLLIDLDGARDQDDWLKRWQAAAGETRIVVLAGFARLQAQHVWKAAGIAAVVAKPITLANLQRALQP